MFPHRRQQLLARSVSFFEQQSLITPLFTLITVRKGRDAHSYVFLAFIQFSVLNPLQLWQSLTICLDKTLYSFFSISGSIYTFKLLSKWDLKSWGDFERFISLCGIFSLENIYAELWSRAVSEGHKCSHLTDFTAFRKNDLNIALENRQHYVLPLLLLRIRL